MDLQERRKLWGLEAVPLTPNMPLADAGLSHPDYPEAKTLRELVTMIQKEHVKTPAELRKEIGMERTFSTSDKLVELEAVINTRTPVWDVDGSGDIRIKLDTDVNEQEWYVLQDDSSRCKPFDGIAYCWAFPHFNGAHDFYRYVPVACCFKTFAEVIEQLGTYAERKVWAYDVEEYSNRLAHKG